LTGNHQVFLAHAHGQQHVRGHVDRRVGTDHHADNQRHGETVDHLAAEQGQRQQHQQRGQ
jgi:hypothetical protein